jgi:hypothetical protein
MSSVEIIHIDNLVRICGNFCVSQLNGGYGCMHPEQSEFEYVKANTDQWVRAEKVKLALLRYKYGSYHNIKSKWKSASRWLYNAMYLPEELIKVNVKKSGHCMPYSCPVATELCPEIPEDREILKSEGLYGDEYDWMEYNTQSEEGGRG